jgi:hypothetical protein
MTGDWTAASVRARGLAARRVGRDACRTLARSSSLADAIVALTHTPYDHDVRSGMDVAAAERAVSKTLLWHLRVLAGWAPSRGHDRVRVLAGAFEIANILGKLAQFDGRPAVAAYELGALATAWLLVDRASNAHDVRAVLAASVWGDPGGTDIPTIGAALSVAWVRRVAFGVPEAANWAKMFGGLLLARMIAAGTPPAAGSANDRNLRTIAGGPWTAETKLADLPAHLAKSASGALDAVDTPDTLWRAEARAWKRVEADALRSQRGWNPGPGAVVAAAALLGIDAWRVRAALECAARGGHVPDEVLDVVA